MLFRCSPTSGTFKSSRADYLIAGTGRTEPTPMTAFRGNAGAAFGPPRASKEPVPKETLKTRSFERAQQLVRDLEGGLNEEKKKATIVEAALHEFITNCEQRILRTTYEEAFRSGY
jgi:hypothetical protein